MFGRIRVGRRIVLSRRRRGARTGTVTLTAVRVTTSRADLIAGSVPTDAELGFGLPLRVLRVPDAFHLLFVARDPLLFLLGGARLLFALLVHGFDGAFCRPTRVVALLRTAFEKRAPHEGLILLALACARRTVLGRLVAERFGEDSLGASVCARTRSDVGRAATRKAREGRDGGRRSGLRDRRRVTLASSFAAAVRLAPRTFIQSGS